MQIHKLLSQLGNGKIIKISIVAVTIGFIVIFNVKTQKSSIQKKLIGTWNIEHESYITGREWNMCGDWINIEYKNVCKLPLVCDFDMEERYFDIKERQKKATGTWQIISTNPDSVFFNVPNNPLHGKYAIRFFIDKNGYMNMGNNIYKIELTNDSTCLICNKGGIIHKNEIRNWENKKSV